MAQVVSSFIADIIGSSGYIGYRVTRKTPRVSRFAHGRICVGFISVCYNEQRVILAVESVKCAILVYNTDLRTG